MWIVLCQNERTQEYAVFHGKIDSVRAQARAWAGEFAFFCCSREVNK
jgi:hypothetical protein